MRLIFLSLCVLFITIRSTGEIVTASNDAIMQLAFEASLPHNDICIINSDGTGYYCLTETSNFIEYNPVWSPDGRFLTYQSTEEPVGMGSSATYVYDFETQVAQALPTAWHNFGWSPDGSALLTIDMDAAGDGEIAVFDLESGDLQRLTDNEVHDSYPAWSPDGQQIAYLSGFPEADLMVMSASGENPQQLTHGFSINTESSLLQWSPDGRVIAFSVKGDFIGADQISEIYTINADGSELRQLTDTGGVNLQPRWSPDGTQLIFFGYALGAFDDISDPDSLRTEVFRINADGSDLVNLSQSSSLDYHPAWSPDGEWIAFASIREKPGIFIMRPDGTDLRMITHESSIAEGGREANNPVWRPIP